MLLKHLLIHIRVNQDINQITTMIPQETQQLCIPENQEEVILEINDKHSVEGIMDRASESLNCLLSA